MENHEEIKQIIRNWVTLDDESRSLQQRQKQLREQKAQLSDRILETNRLGILCNCIR